MKMAIKEELIGVMEHIASTIPTGKITVILCCEGKPQSAALYGSINSRGNFTVLSLISTQDVIISIMDYAFQTANDYARNNKGQQ